MNMDHLRNRVKARMPPALSGAPQGPTASSWQGPLHLHRDSGVVKNVQEFPTLHLHGDLGVVKNMQKPPYLEGGRVVETRNKNLCRNDFKEKPRMDRTCRIGSWNIGSLTSKTIELVECMRRRKVNIMCLQETKWIGEKGKVLDNTGYKLWYSGKDRTRNGVGIIVDTLFIDKVVGVIRKGDRIINLKIIMGNEPINIISVYAPQVGLDENTKMKFWEDLESLIQSIPQNEKFFIGGDLNGHVGKGKDEYERVHGGYGYGTLNNEGKTMLDFSVAYDLVICNTWFKKRDEHLIIFKSGSNKTQINYFLTRKNDKKKM